MRLVPGKAAGSMVTESYPLGYVAGKHATENEVGDRFEHPLHRQHYLTEKLPTNHQLLCRASLLEWKRAVDH